jgi:hypothetical protein
MGMTLVEQPLPGLFLVVKSKNKQAQLRITIGHKPLPNVFISSDRFCPSDQNFCRICNRIHCMQGSHEPFTHKRPTKQNKKLKYCSYVLNHPLNSSIMHLITSFSGENDLKKSLRLVRQTHENPIKNVSVKMNQHYTTKWKLSSRH